MIKTIFANVGAGKTTYLAKIANEESKKIENNKSKYKYIVTTTPLYIKNVVFVEDIRSILKIYVLEDVLLLIDEGSIVYNNRKQNLTENEIMWFKYHRHFNSDVIIVSQSYDDIDITIRRLSTELWHMVKLFGLTILRPIIKKISIDENTYQIVDKYYFKSFLNYRIILRCKYYKYFNTKYRPNNLKYLNIQKKEIYSHNYENSENKYSENSKYSEMYEKVIRIFRKKEKCRIKEDMNN